MSEQDHFNAEMEDASNKTDYIALAIPGFFSLVLLEVVVCLLRGKAHYYRLNDGANSVSLGILMQVLGYILRHALIFPYAYIFENYRIMEVEDTALNWWLLFILVDFVYYWFHRFSHEINILWSAHSVHHSAEEYNLTTALRQGAAQQFGGVIFYYPLALFFSPSFFAVHSAINTLYQFWIHTKLVPKLGLLEYIINTPSQHRVHHGRNPYCIDKNYAGTLCVWDRMFGTFVEEKEEEEIKYGLVHELDTWSPIYDNLRHWVHMYNLMAETPSFWKKIQIPFRGPGWNPNGEDWEVPDVKEQPSIRYNPYVPVHVAVYATLQLAYAIFLVYELLQLKPDQPYTAVNVSGMIVLTVACVGALMDYKKYALVMETFRLSLLLLSHARIFSAFYPALLPHILQLRHTVDEALPAMFKLDAFVLERGFAMTLPSVAFFFGLFFSLSLLYTTLMHAVWYGRREEPKRKAE